MECARKSNLMNKDIGTEVNATESVKGKSNGRGGGGRLVFGNGA
jgi:hypothetical protein